MAKVLYRPFALLTSVLAGVIAGAVFKQIWKAAAGEEDAPGARESEYDWRVVVAAAAVQGAVFGLVKAAVDRGGARAFERLTGVWPGD